MPPRMKLDRDPLGGLADMFGQMPGTLIAQGVMGGYGSAVLNENQTCHLSPC